MSSPNEPPPQNPVMTAYESFVATTPLVTRGILTTQAVSYIVSWFIDPFYALANIPSFTLGKFEIYRIILSPLVNTSLLSLIFAYLSFCELGKRLEYSLGSTAFGWFCLSTALITNVAFLFLCSLLYFITGHEHWWISSASGIWLIVFAAIAYECVKAPADTKRRLFFCEVPVRTYPVAVFALFAVFCNMFSIAYILSLALGYIVGWGQHPWVEKLQLSTAQVTHYEDGMLLNFSRRSGFVTGHSATGMEAWSNMNESGSGGGMMLPLVRPASQTNDSSGQALAGSVFRQPQNTGPTTSATAAFDETLPAVGGRTLGGTTRRGAADARAARLKALEGKEANP